MELVQQDKPWRCTHACLAMLTETSIGTIVQMAGDAPICNNSILAVLSEFKLFGVPNPEGGIPTLEGCYICNVPSLNLPGLMHSIIVQLTEENALHVYDPSPKECWTPTRFVKMYGCTGWISVHDSESQLRLQRRAAHTRLNEERDEVMSLFLS